MSEDSKHPASQPETNSDEGDERKGKTSLWEVSQGVIAALFGVQSAKNRERDFKRGDPADYIAIFTVAVIAMVILMVIFVKVIISSSS